MNEAVTLRKMRAKVLRELLVPRLRCAARRGHACFPARAARHMRRNAKASCSPAERLGQKLPPPQIAVAPSPVRVLHSIEAAQDQRRVVGPIEVLAQRVFDDRALGDPASRAVFGKAVSQFQRKSRANPNARLTLIVAIKDSEKSRDVCSSMERWVCC